MVKAAGYYEGGLLFDSGFGHGRPPASENDRERFKLYVIIRGLLGLVAGPIK